MKTGIAKTPRKKHTRFAPKKKSAAQEMTTPLQPGEAGYYKWKENRFWRILGIRKERKVGKTTKYLVHWKGLDQNGQEWKPEWVNKDMISHEAYRDWVKRKREGRQSKIDANVSGRETSRDWEENMGVACSDEEAEEDSDEEDACKPGDD